MKVLGISCGRKMSNTEILIKEALMGAKEAGAEIEFIRLQDLEIKPCAGCNACVVDLFERSGSGECVLKGDDMAFMDDKILDCDGLILGAPIYEKTPPGHLKNLNDRMGPSHDIAFRMISRDTRAAKKIDTGKGPDKRSFKRRVASLIAVGGSEWDNLALPMLHMFTLSMQIDVVDKMLFNWVALPSIVALHEEKLSRARQSGKHIVNTLNMPVEEATYRGDQGICPMCHSKLFEIRNCKNGQMAVCSVCGVKGNLSVTESSVKFEIPESERPFSHVTLSGKFKHAEELRDHSLVAHPKMSELPERLKTYKSCVEAVKPTR